MVHAPSDDHTRCPGCDWGWIWMQTGTPGLVRPCEQHLAATHAKWLAGAFLPQIPDYWREAA